MLDSTAEPGIWDKVTTISVNRQKNALSNLRCGSFLQAIETS